MRTLPLAFIVTISLIFSGCAAPRITLFPDTTAPLQEFTLEGAGKDKILLLPVSGILSDEPRRQTFGSRPSMVQEIVAHLKKAEQDPHIKAILLKVNSPGGTTTASDILYHEILNFKKKTGAKVIVSMMNIAASGGYYISLPADMIVAHPTTITGSVGVIFMRPGVTGLMEKIGVKMEVNKSGENKDMMSPFRKPTRAERKMMQQLTDDLAGRFISLVKKHRNIEKRNIDAVRSARVFLAEDALKKGMIDQIGYLSDAVTAAKKASGLDPNAPIVVYRRSQYNNDNFYNTSTTQAQTGNQSLVDLGLPRVTPNLNPGFYYIWSPAVGVR